MFKLNNKIEVIVPQFDNDKNAINDANIANALKNITAEFGGATVSQNLGYWVSEESNELMIDENLKYEWYFDNISEKVVNNIENLVSILMEKHRQECISFIFKGNLYLVENKHEITQLFLADTVNQLFN